MVQFSVKDFLNAVSGSLDHPPAENAREQIFNNLITTYAEHYPGFGQMASLDDIEDEKTRQSMTHMHNSLYRRFNELLSQTQFGSLAAKALELKQPAFDKACSIIVSNFFEECIFTQDIMDQECRDILAFNKIEYNSDLGQAMKLAAREILPEFRDIFYREIAGGVFGYALSEIEQEECKAHRVTLMTQALNAVYERHYPEEYDPF